MPASARRLRTPCSMRPLGSPRRILDIDRLRCVTDRSPQDHRRRRQNARRRPWGAGVGDEFKTLRASAIPRGSSDHGDAGDAKTCAWIVIYLGGEKVSMPVTLTGGRGGAHAHRSTHPLGTDPDDRARRHSAALLPYHLAVDRPYAWSHVHRPPAAAHT